MDEKDKKPKFSSLEERKKAHQRELEELALKNKLLGSPELFNSEKGSDEYLDTLSLKIKLIGNRELTYEDYLAEHIGDDRPHFPRAYYSGIAKLYGLDESIMDPYHKPQCAAFFTIQFAYARFPKRVVDTLMKKSKWTDIPGIREVKLFQHLSSIALEQLDLFIAQILDMMDKHDNITSFKLAYSKQYRVYFQIDMFSDITINP